MRRLERNDAKYLFAQPSLEITNGMSTTKISSLPLTDFNRREADEGRPVIERANAVSDYIVTAGVTRIGAESSVPQVVGDTTRHDDN